MTRLMTSEAARALFSVVGALVLSTTLVVAAVRPAKAAAPAAMRGVPTAY